MNFLCLFFIVPVVLNSSTISVNRAVIVTLSFINAVILPVKAAALPYSPAIAGTAIIPVNFSAIIRTAFTTCSVNASIPSVLWNVASITLCRRRLIGYNEPFWPVTGIICRSCSFCFCCWLFFCGGYFCLFNVFLRQGSAFCIIFYFILILNIYRILFC